MDDKLKASTRRRAVNLTIRSDVLDEAKALKLKTSQAAESGIADAIRRAKEEAWLKDNKEAIDAHNARVDTQGPLLPPIWTRR